MLSGSFIPTPTIFLLQTNEVAPIPTASTATLTSSSPPLPATLLSASLPSAMPLPLTAAPHPSIPTATSTPSTMSASTTPGGRGLDRRHLVAESLVQAVIERSGSATPIAARSAPSSSSPTPQRNAVMHIPAPPISHIQPPQLATSAAPTLANHTNTKPISPEHALALLLTSKLESLALAQSTEPSVVTSQQQHPQEYHPRGHHFHHHPSVDATASTATNSKSNAGNEADFNVGNERVSQTMSPAPISAISTPGARKLPGSSGSDSSTGLAAGTPPNSAEVPASRQSMLSTTKESVAAKDASATPATGGRSVPIGPPVVPVPQPAPTTKELSQMARKMRHEQRALLAAAAATALPPSVPMTPGTITPMTASGMATPTIATNPLLQTLTSATHASHHHAHAPMPLPLPQPSAPVASANLLAPPRSSVTPLSPLKAMCVLITDNARARKRNGLAEHKLTQDQLAKIMDDKGRVITVLSDGAGPSANGGSITSGMSGMLTSFTSSSGSGSHNRTHNHHTHNGDPTAAAAVPSTSGSKSGGSSRIPAHLQGAYYAELNRGCYAVEGPRCEHVAQWKRLRAKRGFTYFVCFQCGMKWRLRSIIVQSQGGLFGSALAGINGTNGGAHGDDNTNDDDNEGDDEGALLPNLTSPVSDLTPSGSKEHLSLWLTQQHGQQPSRHQQQQQQLQQLLNATTGNGPSATSTSSVAHLVIPTSPPRIGIDTSPTITDPLVAAAALISPNPTSTTAASPPPPATGEDGGDTMGNGEGQQPLWRFSAAGLDDMVGRKPVTTMLPNESSFGANLVLFNQ